MQEISGGLPDDRRSSGFQQGRPYSSLFHRFFRMFCLDFGELDTCGRFGCTHLWYTRKACHGLGLRMEAIVLGMNESKLFVAQLGIGCGHYPAMDLCQHFMIMSKGKGLLDLKHIFPGFQKIRH